MIKLVADRARQSHCRHPTRERIRINLKKGNLLRAAAAGATGLGKSREQSHSFTTESTSGVVTIWVRGRVEVSSPTAMILVPRCLGPLSTLSAL